MNRKRSHEDMEDPDDCLPISKRINSLHLEGKNAGWFQGQVQGMTPHNGNPDLNSHHHSNQPQQHSNDGASYCHFPANQRLPTMPLPLQQHSQYLAIPNHDNDDPLNGNNHGNNSLSSSSAFHSLLHGNTTTQPQMTHHMDGNGNHLMSNHDNNNNTPPTSVHHNTTNSEQAQHLNFQDPSHYSSHSSLSHPHNQPQCSSSISSNHHIDIHNNGGFINNNGNLIHSTGHHHYNQHQASINPSTINDPGMSGSSGGGNSGHMGGDLSLPNGPYCPELNACDNPHYYTTNKTLYEAHVIRLQRMLSDYQLHS